MAENDILLDLYHPSFPAEWERHSLHYLAVWINGLAFRNVHFSPTGKPVVKIAEIKNGLSGQTKYTQAEYDERYRLVPGDMLFCWSGQPETSIDTLRGTIWNPNGWEKTIRKRIALPVCTSLITGRRFLPDCYMSISLETSGLTPRRMRQGGEWK